MLSIILIAIAVAIAALVLFIASRPGKFRISRSATISAPPDVVFARVNDFRNWQAWSPWARLDPDAKNTFEGITSGAGSTFRWEGNAKVGQGAMSILESEPNERILLQLDFLKPFEATGRSTFVMKAVGLFVNCDKMIGEQYEQGLKNLNEVCQGEAVARR
jgi:uncharacterized protein YndB with AHSA1/START domain